MTRYLFKRGFQIEKQATPTACLAAASRSLLVAHDVATRFDVGVGGAPLSQSDLDTEIKRSTHSCGDWSVDLKIAISRLQVQAMVATTTIPPKMLESLLLAGDGVGYAHQGVIAPSKVGHQWHALVLHHDLSSWHLADPSSGTSTLVADWGKDVLPRYSGWLIFVEPIRPP